MTDPAGVGALGPKKKIRPPPTHCPFCGKSIEVVRPLFSTWFEVACQDCDRTAVISIDDHMKVSL